MSLVFIVTPFSIWITNYLSTILNGTSFPHWLYYYAGFVIITFPSMYRSVSGISILSHRSFVNSLTTTLS